MAQRFLDLFYTDDNGTVSLLTRYRWSEKAKVSTPSKSWWTVYDDQLNFTCRCFDESDLE